MWASTQEGAAPVDCRSPCKRANEDAQVVKMQGRRRIGAQGPAEERQKAPCGCWAYQGCDPAAAADCVLANSSCPQELIHTHSMALASALAHLGAGRFEELAQSLEEAELEVRGADRADGMARRCDGGRDRSRVSWANSQAASPPPMPPAGTRSAVERSVAARTAPAGPGLRRPPVSAPAAAAARRRRLPRRVPCSASAGPIEV